jgi:hypothetical protein
VSTTNSPMTTSPRTPRASSREFQI